jgi:hypothetical protein
MAAMFHMQEFIMIEYSTVYTSKHALTCGMFII